MIKFPDGMVQLDRFPGYYWVPVKQELYSCKVGGVLRKLTMKKAFRGYIKGAYFDVPDGWDVSVNGQRRFITLIYLNRQYPIGVDESITQTFPMKEQYTQS